MNLELGVRLSAFNGRLFADANIYLLLVEDLLVTERLSEDIFYGKNAGKTRHMGVEGSASLRLNENSHTLLPQTQLDVSLAFADNRFTDFTDEGNDYTGNALPGVPATVFFTGATFFYPFGLYTTIQYKHTGSQYLDDGNTGSYGAYDLVYLKLGYRLGGKRWSTDIHFGIQNLFNRHYASMLLVNAPSFGSYSPRYYYPGLPRNFYAGLSIDF
jgi:iron complex outermembrane receptor protein